MPCGRHQIQVFLSPIHHTHLALTLIVNAYMEMVLSGDFFPQELGEDALWSTSDTGLPFTYTSYTFSFNTDCKSLYGNGSEWELLSPGTRRGGPCGRHQIQVSLSPIHHTHLALTLIAKAYMEMVLSGNFFHQELGEEAPVVDIRYRSPFHLYIIHI